MRAERLVSGFVLFAPNTTYPQHSHHEIEESYVSVADAWSENETAVHAPGSLILNRPGEEHRITTGRFDPVLLAYAWVGPDERLSAPGMKFSRTRKARVEQGICRCECGWLATRGGSVASAMPAMRRVRLS